MELSDEHPTLIEVYAQAVEKVWEHSDRTAVLGGLANHGAIFVSPDHEASSAVFKHRPVDSEKRNDRPLVSLVVGARHPGFGIESLGDWMRQHPKAGVFPSGPFILAAGKEARLLRTERAELRTRVIEHEADATELDRMLRVFGAHADPDPDGNRPSLTQRVGTVLAGIRLHVSELPMGWSDPEAFLPWLKKLVELTGGQLNATTPIAHRAVQRAASEPRSSVGERLEVLGEEMIIDVDPGAPGGDTTAHQIHRTGPACDAQHPGQVRAPNIAGWFQPRCERDTGHSGNHAAIVDKRSGFSLTWAEGGNSLGTSNAKSQWLNSETAATLLPRVQHIAAATLVEVAIAIEQERPGAELEIVAAELGTVRRVSLETLGMEVAYVELGTLYMRTIEADESDDDFQSAEVLAQWGGYRWGDRYDQARGAALAAAHDAEPIT